MQPSLSRIDPRPPEVSLTRAIRSTGVAALLALVSLAVAPACPLLSVLFLPGLLLTAWYLKVRRRSIALANEELGKKRGFRFTGMAVPLKKGKDGKPVPPKNMWSVEFPPFKLELESDVYVTGEVKAWRKVLAAPPAWLAVLDQQREWIQDHVPTRWEVAVAWWERWYLNPLLMRRHGSGEPTTEQADRAAQACSVELRGAVAIAGQPALWKRRIGFGEDEATAFDDLSTRLALLGDAPPEGAPPFPQWKSPEYRDLFIGKGFLWEAGHTQKTEDLKLRNLSDITQENEEQGDPRIYGVGSDKAADLFMDEPQFNQMAGIFGSTGVGNTRYAEALLVQVVRSGMPLLVIDPKGDQALTNRLLEECRLAGRGHQFQYFCLAAPKEQRTWSFLSRYNPCYSYTDPAELAARVASVLPATKDPFWTNVAKTMLENCMTLCHWANWYLCFLSRNPDGTHPPRESRQVPRLFLAMQWARHNPRSTPAQAAAAIDGILANMRDRTWKPVTPVEREVVDLCTLESLAGVPIYAPIEWIPTVRHVDEYEINNTVPFLAWMLKLFYFDLYLTSHQTAAPAFPKVADYASIVSKGGKGGKHEDEPSMWALYQGVRYHPLQARYEPNADVGLDQKRWVAFYDYFVPPLPGDEDALRRMFKAVRIVLDAHYADCAKERQKFLEHATTLSSALKPFTGERSRIMCSVESDLDWESMIGESQVVYCALSSMIDDVGATSCAKMIVQDIASYFGRRYQYEGGKALPVYIFADEVSSFINDPFIHLLNKCRGVGLRCLVAGQTRADLARQLGREGAQQVMGNLNTVIQLRSPLIEDAAEFAGRAGEARVIQESRSVSTQPGIGKTGNVFVSGFSANESRSYQQQTVKRIPQEAVLSLPRGQAFVHAKGQVWLLAQGMFDDPKANLYEEIGMHRGIMVEPLRPMGRAPLASSIASVPLAPSSTAPAIAVLPASTPAPTAPVAPAPATAPAPGATYRDQTNLARMADGPDARPMTASPAPAHKPATTSLRDAALEDAPDAPPRPPTGTAEYLT